MRLVLFAALLLVSTTCATACGAPIISVQSVSTGVDSSGTLNVTISNPDAVSYNIGGFDIHLLLSGSGIDFTGVTMATDAPYIFQGHSLAENTASPFSFDVFPNQDFIASDLYDGPLGSTTLAPGQTLGLLLASFTVAPDYSLMHKVFEVSIGGFTFLADEFGNPIPFAVSNGEITVTPEPASLAAWGIATLAGAWCLKRRRTTTR